MKVKFKKNPRLQSFDYATDGYYFITNNTHFSKSFIHGETKEIIRKELFDLENRFLGVKVYYFSLMPTHIHVILELNECTEPIPEIWRVFKSITTVKLKQNGFTEKYLWQKNYFEHIVRNEKALQRIVLYIGNNPDKEGIALDEIYGDRIPKLEI